MSGAGAASTVGSRRTYPGGMSTAVLGTSVGQQVAFVICIVIPVGLIAVPLFLAHRRRRKEERAQLRTDA